MHTTRTYVYTLLNNLHDFMLTLKYSVWLGVFMLQNVETALTGEFGQMSLVNDYQTFDPI